MATSTQDRRSVQGASCGSEALALGRNSPLRDEVGGYLQGELLWPSLCLRSWDHLSGGGAEPFSNSHKGLLCILTGHEGGLCTHGGVLLSGGVREAFNRWTFCK